MYFYIFQSCPYFILKLFIKKKYDAYFKTRQFQKCIDVLRTYIYTHIYIYTYVYGIFKFSKKIRRKSLLSNNICRHKMLST